MTLTKTERVIIENRVNSLLEEAVKGEARVEELIEEANLSVKDKGERLGVQATAVMAGAIGRLAEAQALNLKFRLVETAPLSSKRMTGSPPPD